MSVSAVPRVGPRSLLPATSVTRNSTRVWNQTATRVKLWPTGMGVLAINHIAFGTDRAI
jgi:hypothetical protein